MSQFTIQRFTGGYVQTNGYLVTTPQSCFVVDAPAGMADFVEKSGHSPTHLLLTHQHFDHVEDALALQQQGLKLFSYEDYNPTIVRDDFARSMGLPVKVSPFAVDQTLAGTTSLDLSGQRIQLRHVPGHSPDSLVFYLSEFDLVLSGDTLFQRSIGRTDLPGGSHEQLLTAIRTELFSLPDHTQVLPGHGSATTIGEEKTQNPYL